MRLKKMVYAFLACTIFCISELKSLAIYDYCRLFKEAQAARKTANIREEREILQKIITAGEAEQSNVVIKYLENNGLKSMQARLKELDQKISPAATHPSTIEKISKEKSEKEVRLPILNELENELNSTPKEFLDLIGKELSIIKNFVKMTTALFQNESANRKKIDENLVIIGKIKPLLEYWLKTVKYYKGRSTNLLMTIRKNPLKIKIDFDPDRTKNPLENVLDLLDTISETKEYKEFTKTKEQETKAEAIVARAAQTGTNIKFKPPVAGKKKKEIPQPVVVTPVTPPPVITPRPMGNVTKKRALFE